MANKSLADSKFNGRWTRQEHNKFMEGLQLYGKDWKKIQALIGTRNGAQIRSHAQKFFIKVKKQCQNTDNNDHWEQTKESPPENITSASIQSTTECQARAQYSYYLNKLVQKEAFKQNFDFWGKLIDHKSLQNCQIQISQKRNSSFMRIGLQRNEMEVYEERQTMQQR